MLICVPGKRLKCEMRCTPMMLSPTEGCHRVHVLLVDRVATSITRPPRDVTQAVPRWTAPWGQDGFLPRAMNTSPRCIPCFSSGGISERRDTEEVHAAPADEQRLRKTGLGAPCAFFSSGVFFALALLESLEWDFWVPFFPVPFLVGKCPIISWAPVIS